MLYVPEIGGYRGDIVGTVKTGADIGTRPAVGAHPGYDRNRLYWLSDAPIPSLVQFSHTNQYAIYLGACNVYQVVDLDGHLKGDGGFFGFRHFERDLQVLVWRLQDPTEFLSQLKYDTDRILGYFCKASALSSPAVCHVLSLLVQDILARAVDLDMISSE